MRDKTKFCVYVHVVYLYMCIISIHAYVQNKWQVAKAKCCKASDSDDSGRHKHQMTAPELGVSVLRVRE